MFIADADLQYAREAIEKVLLKNEGQGLAALKAIEPLFAAVFDWKAPALEETVKKYCESTGVGLGKVAQPLRVAVSGSMISPPIFESIVFLGKEKTLARIERCIRECAK
jgi:glutamyl-tRNA synthetase